MSSIVKILKRAYSTSTYPSLPKESSVTRIRIWKSGYFGPDKGFVHTNVLTALYSVKPSRQPNIGHVSIETRDLYASLWPRGINITNKLKPQRSDHQDHTPETDQIAEARAPDLTVDLHTLEVEKINIELERFVKLGSVYHLLGSNPYLKNLGAHSCSSLAYHLLSAGGIHKLGIKTHVIRDYIVVTPNNLATLVVEAQTKEEVILRSRD
jgi:hypothetical protein